MSDNQSKRNDSDEDIPTTTGEENSPDTSSRDAPNQSTPETQEEVSSKKKEKDSIIKVSFIHFCQTLK